MTIVDTRVVPGPDVATALARLAAAGHPTDITDPQGLRTEIGELLRSLLAEDYLTEANRAVIAQLQAAGRALDTDADRAWSAKLVADMATFLAYEQDLTDVPPPPRTAEAVRP